MDNTTQPASPVNGIGKMEKPSAASLSNRKLKRPSRWQMEIIPCPTPTATEAPVPTATKTQSVLEKSFSLPRLSLTFDQLKQLAKEKGVIPKGDKRKKTTYLIDALKLALAA
jgi:hypothetical protein